jgi:hypothetical protein
VDTTRTRAIELIESERLRQEKKYMEERDQISDKGVKAYLKDKICVISEEWGETVKEINNKFYDLALEEAVQNAACALALVEGLLLIREGLR